MKARTLSAVTCILGIGVAILAALDSRPRRVTAERRVHLLRLESGFHREIHLDPARDQRVNGRLRQEIASETRAPDRLAETPAEHVGRAVDAALQPFDVGMLGIRDLAYRIPPKGMDVQAQRVPISGQLVEQIPVLVDNKINPAEAPLQIRIEANQPGGMERAARKRLEMFADDIHPRHHGLEPTPWLGPHSRLKFFGFDIDVPDRRDYIGHASVMLVITMPISGPEALRPCAPCAPW